MSCCVVWHATESIIPHRAALDRIVWKHLRDLIPNLSLFWTIGGDCEVHAVHWTDLMANVFMINDLLFLVAFSSLLHTYLLFEIFYWYFLCMFSFFFFITSIKWRYHRLKHLDRSPVELTERMVYKVWGVASNPFLRFVDSTCCFLFYNRRLIAVGRAAV